MYRDTFEVGSPSGNSNRSKPDKDAPQGLAFTGDAVLAQLQPMLNALASKLAFGDRDLRADYFQEGVCAVLTAVSRFNPNKGSVLCYAARCARGTLLNRRRWLRYRQREILVGAFTESDADETEPSGEISMKLGAARAAVQAPLLDAVDCRLIRQLASRILTMNEFRSLELVHCEGWRANEVAAEMRVSAPRVTQLVSSALRKLRTQLLPVRISN